MAAFRTLAVALLLIITFAAIFSTSTAAQGSPTTEYSLLGFAAGNDGDGDGGLVADSLDMEEEMMMESESARRQLRGRGRGGHVSYGAMNRANIPCNQRGQSYYSSCRAHQQANPYSRQCTRATRCSRNNR